MSNLLSLKLKQIEVLKSRYPTVKEISKDSTFKIPLLGGNSIVISLPVNFPNIPPVYFLESPDGQTISVKPPAEWTPMTSLAKVTMEYIEFYSKNPPQFQHYSPPPSYFNNNNSGSNMNSNLNHSNPNNISNSMIPSSQQGLPPPPYSSKPDSKASSGSNSNGNSSNNVQKPVIPSIPNKFPELETKSKEEMEALLDSGEIEIIMFSLDEVTIMGNQRDKLQSANEQLQTPINPKKEKIAELKAHLEEQKKLYEQLKAESDIKQKRKDEIQKSLSSAVLIEKLTDLASASESESDQIANDFLEGTIDLKEFKKQFKEKRNIYHSRLAKRDGLISGISKDK